MQGAFWAASGKKTNNSHYQKKKIQNNLCKFLLRRRPLSSVDLAKMTDRGATAIISRGWPFHYQVQKVHSPNLPQEKCMGEVARISSVIIFQLSQL